MPCAVICSSRVMFAMAVYSTAERPLQAESRPEGAAPQMRTREMDRKGGKNEPKGRPGARRTAVIAVLLALLAALPYLQTFGYDFIDYDDSAFVTANPDVQAGLTGEGVRWALTAAPSANWMPVAWLSHMLDITLFGMDPGWHHLVNAVIHALSTALLFLALHRMTGSVWRSAFVAALFGIHPLHVESVAWVAERKDVLSGLFFMLVLLAYERYARRGGAGRYLLVAALLALGLMA